MTGLGGKVAIVTGSTGGIGRAVALKLAGQGAKVVVNGRNDNKGATVVEQIESRGGEAIFVKADVQSKEHMNALVAATLERFGRIDILVVSAGGADDQLRRVRALFAETEPAEVAEALANATVGKLNPVKAVTPQMVAQCSGSIVFITSEGGRVPTPGQTAVSLHAGGLIMFSKVLAKELSRFRVRVNCVAVTLVKNTPSWDVFTNDAAQPASMMDNYTKIRDKAPFGLADAEDIGNVVSFLASDEAMFITGTTISPTGGLTYS
jgi:3-oxoacyl-[acyl-carrier protein] reductase